MESQRGIHGGRTRPSGGWPNTCKPQRQHVNSKGQPVEPKALRKAKAKLAKRIKDFEDLKGAGGGSRKGAKFVTPMFAGKSKMYHRPGSMKK